MSVLHIGTHQPQVVRDFIAGKPEFTIIDQQGFTSWEEWGESPWPGEPEHILVNGAETVDADYLALVGDLMFAHPGILRPMAFESQRGALACITPWSDWSEPTLDLKDTRAAHWLARNPAPGRDQDRWAEDTAWIEYLDEREGDEPLI